MRKFMYRREKRAASRNNLRTYAEEPMLHAKTLTIGRADR